MANGHQSSIELETFLPSKDGPNSFNNKATIVSSKKQGADSDSVHLDGKGRWDPFKERNKLVYATSNCDTLIHLLKAALGTGILAMPIAFKYSGLAAGVFATIMVAIICTHCAYIVVKCAHELYHRTRVSTMSYADVGEIAFATGPQQGRKFSKSVRLFILGGLVATYFGACSVYVIFIAQNLQQVIEYYADVKLSSRLCIASLWIPLVLLCWVPNIKKLTPISMLANLLMAAGLMMTFYFISFGLHSISELPKVAPLKSLPQFFSITIFALEVIGLVMPLENAMRTPQKFIGFCGILYQGMATVTLIFLFLGFLGYLKYGEETQASITLNLPTESLTAQAVKICVGLAVFFSYGLQYFVFEEIIWNGVREYTQESRVVEYCVRTLLTSFTVILAIGIPTLEPFIALIGAFCFSFLGIIIPLFIEIITFWDKGFGPCYWMIWKNVLIFFFGILAMLSGSYSSVMDIIKLYTDPEISSGQMNNNTIAANASVFAKEVVNSLINNFTITS